MAVEISWHRYRPGAVFSFFFFFFGGGGGAQMYLEPCSVRIRNHNIVIYTCITIIKYRCNKISSNYELFCFVCLFEALRLGQFLTSTEYW